MNIIDFWKKQIEIWNEENKCGFCWVFSGATTLSGIEEYQIREDSKCCVHVFITDDRYRQQNNYNTPPFISSKLCSTTYTIWFLVSSKLGVMNHMEVRGQDSLTSIEETIITPLNECITCDLILDECEAMGYLFEVPNWQSEKVRHFTSHEFAGLKITTTFQERN